MIGNSWPIYSQKEIEAVSNVLKSGRVNYWTGNEARLFEQEFAEFCGCSEAVAVSNGTVALELALRSLKIGLGDEVIVTPRTFIASVSAIVNVGARPVFVDVDLISQNITPETISVKLGPNTKAIICVHLAGWPCDMDPIMDLAKKNNLKVIEDCAQAHGAKYKGKSVGSIGHVGCWSFCQDKIMSTGGEGGMVTTSDSKIAEFIWSYKDHGKTRDSSPKGRNLNGFPLVHNSFGSNHRMTEIQAVIGRLQLEYMEGWSRIRRDNLRQIWRAAADSKSFKRPMSSICNDCSAQPLLSECDQCRHAAYKAYVFAEHGIQERDRCYEELNKKGIFCRLGSCPEVYLEPAFDDTSLRPRNRLENARKLGETSLMFNCDPGMNAADIDRICIALTVV